VATTTREPELTPIKSSRLTRRGVLLGLSGPQLVMASLASGTLIIGLYIGAVVMTFPIILFFAALAFVGIGGRKLIEWAPIGARWLWRSAGGQLLYRRRVVKPRPAGTLALPGDAARLRQWVDPETGAVMVHDPHAATLTAIVGVSHPAFVLLDPAEQERRVVSWGRVLATACRSGRISSVQVMERTLPDSGKGLADWWEQHGNRSGSWASTTYGELVDRAGPAGERHASTVSISLDMKVAGRAIRAAGGGMRGAAAVLRQEMATMLAALRSADLSPGDWLTPGDLALILRSAYDPAVAGALERQGDIGRDLATAGPVAVTEAWGSLRSDSAHHCVLWISEWPRSLVYPGFLAPLLLSSGIRRTFTLLYTPMRTDRAARDIRKKKTEYISDAAQRQKIGQIEDAQQTAEYQDVLQQEADLTAGHGVLRATVRRRQRQRPRRTRARRRGDRTGRDTGVLRDAADLGPAGSGLRDLSTPAVPIRVAREGPEHLTDHGHPRSEFNWVVVGAEFSPELAEVLEARQRRRLCQIDDAPDDRMHHLGVATLHRLIKPREHLGIGLGPFLEDSIEVELQDTLGRPNPIDLNVFFSCNRSALCRLSLTDLAILACCSDDLV